MAANKPRDCNMRTRALLKAGHLGDGGPCSWVWGGRARTGLPWWWLGVERFPSRPFRPHSTRVHAGTR